MPHGSTSQRSYRDRGGWPPYPRPSLDNVYKKPDATSGRIRFVADQLKRRGGGAGCTVGRRPAYFFAPAFSAASLRRASTISSWMLFGHWRKHANSIENDA